MLDVIFDDQIKFNKTIKTQNEHFFIFTDKTTLLKIFSFSNI